jgi:hypothetical protein
MFALLASDAIAAIARFASRRRDGSPRWSDAPYLGM